MKRPYLNEYDREHFKENIFVAIILTIDFLIRKVIRNAKRAKAKIKKISHK